MLNINTIVLKKGTDRINYWAKFELDNEKIECKFICDGDVVHTVSNIVAPYGVIGMVVYLSDNNNAVDEVQRIIESANKSTHSKLKGLTVVHG